MNKQQKGFTLLEILIALFIFSIVSLLLTGALKTVIEASTGTEQNAKQLRELQFGLLILSRDVEQTVDRPVWVDGKQEEAWLGSSTAFTFTHAGNASMTASSNQSDLQRVRYICRDNSLWREVFPVLDRVKNNFYSRLLLSNVSHCQFQYLDQPGQFHSEWPIEKQGKEILPRALSVKFTFVNGNTIQQLFILPLQNRKVIPNVPKPPQQP